ncbi:MAG TPA: response regulator transcription factor [Bacteroidales bacterium]|nr:response regulator transcription factor [Bacteroidales bacterium]
MMIKIAVADDMPIVVEGVRLILENIDDFSVVAEYANGKELVDHIGESDAEIALVDIDMPVMDGITATRLLLSEHKDIKVIALSMYSDPANYIRMMQAGARGFVLKQSTPRELEKAVRDVHEGYNFFSPGMLQNVLFDFSGIYTEHDVRHDSASLSRKEEKLLSLICEGMSNKELSDTLCISIKTIESQKARLMEKAGVKNSSGLILWAIRNKLIDI